MFDPLLLLGGAATIVVSGSIGMMALSCFQKCGPNQAMIISGLGTASGARNFLIVVGGGAVVWPVLQQRAFISLELMSVSLKPETPLITKDGIPLTISATAQCKVPSDYESIAAAAEYMLNKSDEEIRTIVHQSLLGHSRAIVGMFEMSEVVRALHPISARVQELAEQDLKKLGLTIVSFIIDEMKDESNTFSAAPPLKIAK